MMPYSTCCARSDDGGLRPILRLTRVIFFFFSSRRRHTRLQGDWSSDVCSSDLQQPSIQTRSTAADTSGGKASREPRRAGRSEERRVGKEGRSRWSPYH